MEPLTPLETADLVDALFPAAPANVKPPTPDEIDAAIVEYESAQRLVKAAQETADGVKQRLIFLVDHFGEMPAQATASHRLAGRHNEAVVTRGVTTTVNEPAVADFEEYLESKGRLELFARFFAVETKHSIVSGAVDVLKTIQLPKMIEEKLFQLYGRTITVKTKSPSLKVSIITPEKPARKPRGGKAAA